MSAEESAGWGMVHLGVPVVEAMGSLELGLMGHNTFTKSHLVGFPGQGRPAQPWAQSLPPDVAAPASITHLDRVLQVNFACESQTEPLSWRLRRSFVPRLGTTASFFCLAY